MLKKEVLSYMKEYELSIDDVDELIENAIYDNGIEELLEFIAGEDHIRNLAIGITHYCFRNGPIEDMHAGISKKYATENTKPENISLLSEEDMKKLNKYMVDKLGFLIHLLVEGRYFETALLLEYPLSFGRKWDPPNIEKEEKYLEELFNILRKRTK